MMVYIEYAFLQNFFLDGVLIWLSSKGMKRKIKRRNLIISSLFGAIFAVVYPLLRLTSVLGVLLKLCAGLLLCMLAFGKIQGKKEWKDYLFFTSLFFSLSFLFGGALSGATQGVDIRNLKTVVIPFAFVLLTFACLRFFAKLYKKRSVLCCVYDCVITNGEKSFKAQGFLDSGNAATKKGIPVCFVSPETVYELWGAEILNTEGGGQVCDELSITTMSGEKKVLLYKGGLEIITNGKRRVIEKVYFAPSANMISREYTMILHSRIFDEGEEI